MFGFQIVWVFGFCLLGLFLNKYVFCFLFIDFIFQGKEERSLGRKIILLDFCFYYIEKFFLKYYFRNFVDVDLNINYRVVYLGQFVENLFVYWCFFWKYWVLEFGSFKL